MIILPLFLAGTASAFIIPRQDPGAAASSFIPTLESPADIPSASSWPYNATSASSLPHVRLAPVNHPTPDTSPSESLRPTKRHLLFLANTAGEPQGDKKPISAALLLETKEDVVNLGASDVVSGIKCDGGKLTIEFKSPAAVEDMKKIWAENVVFMDAYGEGCGKPDELRFMRSTSSPTVSDSSMAYDFKEEQEKDVVSDFKAGWGDKHKEAIESLNSSRKRRAPRDFSGNLTPAEFDELDMLFMSDWPELGTLPPAAINSLEKRWWGTYSWDKKYDIDFMLTSDITPFGPGKVIFTDDDEHFSVHCVGCGIRGPLATSGAVSWSILDGITGGTAFVSHSLSGQLAIGIESGTPVTTASGTKLEKEFKKTFSLPLSPLNLGGLFIAGPAISLEPFVKAELKTIGRLLVGGNVTWSNALATHDFLDTSKSTSENWSPTAKPVFRVDAEIAAEAAAGIRFSVDFGLSVPLANWKKGISIVDEPSIYARASSGISMFIDEHTGKLKLDGVKPPEAHENCRGINFEMGLQNKLYFSVDVWENKKFMLWNPFPYKPFEDYCWKVEEMAEWANKEKPSCRHGEECAFKEHKDL